MNLGAVRVTNNFNSKNNCDSRFYEYLLPTYVLDYASKILYPKSAIPEEHSPVSEVNIEEKRKLFRASEKTLSHLKECLGKYVGTHNFHNFTVHCKFNANSAKRYIKSFEVLFSVLFFF